jgi:hypothetical protein
MKTASLRIRNAAFYLQLASLVSFFALLPLLDFLKLPRPGFPRWVDIHLAAFSVLGLVVLLLTLKASEARIQKASFLLAGGAGITVPMILLCPPVFFVGAVSAIVCIIRGGKSGKVADPGGTARVNIRVAMTRVEGHVRGSVGRVS